MGAVMIKKLNEDWSAWTDDSEKSMFRGCASKDELLKYGDMQQFQFLRVMRGEDKLIKAPDSPVVISGLIKHFYKDMQPKRILGDVSLSDIHNYINGEERSDIIITAEGLTG